MEVRWVLPLPIRPYGPALACIGTVFGYCANVYRSGHAIRIARAGLVQQNTGAHIGLWCHVPLGYGDILGHSRNGTCLPCGLSDLVER